MTEQQQRATPNVGRACMSTTAEEQDMDFVVDGAPVTDVLAGRSNGR